MNRLCCLILVLALSACAPAATPTPTATTEPTLTPIPPTNTPTPVPLDQIDLESLLIAPGDLDAGFQMQQIKDKAPVQFKEMPEPEALVSQGFLKDGLASDGVTIWLYASAEDVIRGLASVARVTEPAMNQFDGPGEVALASDEMMTLLAAGAHSTQVAFKRCAAVVYIQIFSYQDLDATKAYAKRLDNRIKTVVCQ